jgi:synaptic vesicle membrane protein VAT-1
MVQGLTVYYGLKTLAQIERGEVVLIHSAAGGCGQQALKICRALGCRPVAIVGGEDKKKLLLREYADVLTDATVLVRPPGAREFAAQLDRSLEALGAEGFDIVLDATLGDYFQPGYDRCEDDFQFFLVVVFLVVVVSVSS